MIRLDDLELLAALESNDGTLDKAVLFPFFKECDRAAHAIQRKHAYLERRRKQLKKARVA
jgi:hypothetical protein